MRRKKTRKRKRRRKRRRRKKEEEEEEEGRGDDEEKEVLPLIDEIHEFTLESITDLQERRMDAVKNKDNQ